MTLLNAAKAIRLGVNTVDRVYAGNTKVWPFNPTDVAGLANWLDASQLGLADGAPVTSWPDLADLSGFNRAFTPKTAGRPTYKVAGLNGLGVIHYDPDINRTLHYENHESTFRHVFVVARFRLALFDNWNGLIGGGSGNDLLFVGNAGQPYWYNHWGGDTIYHFDRVLTPLNHTGPMGNVWHQFGISRISGPWTFWQLQFGQDRGETRYWDGDVAEVITYDRVLTTSERVKIEDYLQNKWLV
jgi:hypothetical protein